MESMYETLLGLPIFAGVSRQKISEIIGKNKFHFLKYTQGDTIVTKGELCTHIKSIIAGKVRVTIESDGDKFKVSQTLDAPDVIAPDFFFGRTTRYPVTVKALESTGIMQIDKSDFLNIINSDSIFLFNYLNMLSMNAQRSIEGVLALTTGSLERRIAYWIIALTQPNGYDITLQCRQHDMYAIFGVPRQSLVAALEAMSGAGLISFTQSEINVTDRRLLLDLLDV